MRVAKIVRGGGRQWGHLGLAAVVMLAGTSCGQAESSAPELPPIVAQVQACTHARARAEGNADDAVKFYCSVPIFAVDDLQATLSYYRDVLGFETAWEWGTPATFAASGRGDVQVFFCEGCQGGPGTFVSVFVSDVDALFREYKAHGAKILAPPTDEQWGVREMWVQDLDGHVLRLGHNIDEH